MNEKQSLKLKGKTRTMEMKERYRNAAYHRPKKFCSHCQKEIAINIFSKFHGDNCKNRGGV